MSTSHQGLVRSLLPGNAKKLGASLRAQHHVSFAVIDMAVTKHDVSMWVVLVLTLVVDHSQPRTHAIGHGIGVFTD